jgi:hypothetical protein
VAFLSRDAPIKHLLDDLGQKIKNDLMPRVITVWRKNQLGAGAFHCDPIFGEDSAVNL